MSEQTATGGVDGIILMQGRQEVFVRMVGVDQPFWLSDGGCVTWDGKVVSLDELVLLYRRHHQVWVTLHPRTDRYMASIDAEFTSVL